MAQFAVLIPLSMVCFEFTRTSFCSTLACCSRNDLYIIIRCSQEFRTSACLGFLFLRTLFAGPVFEFVFRFAQAWWSWRDSAFTTWWVPMLVAVPGPIWLEMVRRDRFLRTIFAQSALWILAFNASVSSASFLLLQKLLANDSRILRDVFLLCATFAVDGFIHLAFLDDFASCASCTHALTQAVRQFFFEKATAGPFLLEVCRSACCPAARIYLSTTSVTVVASTSTLMTRKRMNHGQTTTTSAAMVTKPYILTYLFSYLLI